MNWCPVETVLKMTQVSWFCLKLKSQLKDHREHFENGSKDKNKNKNFEVSIKGFVRMNSEKRSSYSPLEKLQNNPSTAFGEELIGL